MKELSATEGARNFSEVLDAVERDHEEFVVLRSPNRGAALGRLMLDTSVLVAVDRGRARFASQPRHWRSS